MEIHSGARLQLFETLILDTNISMCWCIHTRTRSHMQEGLMRGLSLHCCHPAVFDNF